MLLLCGNPEGGDQKCEVTSGLLFLALGQEWEMVNETM